MASNRRGLQCHVLDNFLVMMVDKINRPCPWWCSSRIYPVVPCHSDSSGGHITRQITMSSAYFPGVHDMLPSAGKTSIHVCPGLNLNGRL
jgi:hypothetical protein